MGIFAISVGPDTTTKRVVLKAGTEWNGTELNQSGRAHSGKLLLMDLVSFITVTH